MTTTRTVEIGSGIYTLPEASEILRSIGHDVSTRELRYWMNAGLASPIPVADEDFAVLSFGDLVSLEIVRRFKSLGASLQRIRRFDIALREEYPDLEHPLAYKIFFTDGANVWAELGGGSGAMIELFGRRRNHYVWPDAVKTFAKEIRWSDGQPAYAAGWNLTPWVEIDPLIQFGAPVVRGTRIPVHTIAANLRAGKPADVADWYGLDIDAVRGVRDYLAIA
jgi:uncharacterized protein (DUF433 family)